MLLKEITFINLPNETGIAVFGMDDDQWTVNSSDALTYFSGESNGNKVVVSDFNPEKPKVLIRIFSRENKWRTDKEFKNPVTGRYAPELVLKTDEVDSYIFDGEDYLESDDVLIERPKREPIIKIKDKTDYSSPNEISIPKQTQKFSREKFDINDMKNKSIVATITNFNSVQFEDFRHSLPRPLINLLHFPRPIGNNHFRIAFFHVDFANLDDVSKAEKEKKPWFYKKENAELLFEAKKKFIAFIKDNISQISFLSTRELKNYGYIQEELPLRLPNIYSSDKRQAWRYLTLPKFVDLLSTSKLWFAKPSTFSDPFESKTNKKTRAEQVWKMMNRILDDYNIAVYEKDNDYLINQEWVVLGLEKDQNGKVKHVEFNNFSEVPENLKNYSEYNLNNLLDSQLVNSWHINENESEGMWNLYSDSEYGIVIISDQERIRNSFRTNFGSPNILEIQYHDLHNEEKIYDHLPSAYKHSAFRHEEELRVYIGASISNDSTGLSIDIDLNVLIKKIVISPNSKEWFKRNILWLIERAGYSFEVDDSIFKNKLY